ncbi:MAG: GGDEF domain-containing protein [Spirochaetota bacterium]|nr:GGDEF domain-containing protein [Spirochaetota bacterium]
MEDNVTFLQQVDIFSLLTIDEINIVISRLQFVDIDENKILFQEGDEGNELFIVKMGRVASSVLLPNGNKREIAEFTSGDFFGEMSIFENAPRSATCCTKDKCLLISLRERDFFELILYYPHIAIKMMYRMLNITTERLLEKSKFLSDMVQWGEEARRRAITDELTGIYNRRFLDDALEDHFQKARGSDKSLSMIMIDIDNFKKISEIYGHQKVNHVVLQVVEVFKKHIRGKDILARYGGDEFTILLPDTEMNKAREIAERIGRDVAEINLSQMFNGQVTQITVSQGISTYPENVEDLQNLCKLADRHLYRAKVEGRNRVICSE